MTPRKLKFFFAFFPYGGNGGFASEHPAIRNWFPRVLRELWKDGRVEDVWWNDFNDTPITMTRNNAVLEARKRGADVLVMVDSDMHPDHSLEVDKDPRAKPFIASSFDKIYEHYEQGPLVICAPYCGAPFYEENVFVFRWTNRITNSPTPDWKLEPYTRGEAQAKIGFEEIGAGATGLMMCDMRIFDVTEPEDESEKPWFYYEYRDKFQAEKISTEDVTFTRDASLMGSAKLGYNPVLANWDAWAGHYKPKCVSKPRVYTADKIAKKHAAAYAEALDSRWADLQVGAGETSVNVPPEIIQRFIRLNAKQPVNVPSVPDVNHSHPVEVPRDVEPFILNPGNISTGVFSPGQFGVAAATEQLTKSLAEGEVENLRELRQRQVFNPLGHVTPESDLKVLQRLVQDQVSRTENETVHCLEIGSWVGSSAIAMAVVNPRVHVRCIDHFEGNDNDRIGSVAEQIGNDTVEETFHQNVRRAGVSSQVMLTKGRAEEKLPGIRDGAFHLVFLDAKHDYRSLATQIEACLPKVKKNGILCGHDYSDAFPGVKQAVAELQTKGHVVRVEGNVWWTRVGHLCLGAPSGTLPGLS